MTSIVRSADSPAMASAALSRCRVFSVAALAGLAAVELAGAGPAMTAEPADLASPQPDRARPSMIDAGLDSAGFPVELSFVDFGRGKPVVLIHKWPLCKESWEPQLAKLPKHIRVTAYDRRGFGKSFKPWDGYDSDKLADDLKAVLDQLDLQDVTLVGFSMSGCELARYMSRHDSARVAKVVFVSDVAPFPFKTDDNLYGKDKDIFENMTTCVEQDRPAYLAEFPKAYYAFGAQSPVLNPVNQLILDWTMGLALQVSCRATTECVITFSASDHRQGLPKIRVPTLFIHGSGDLMTPPESSLACLVPRAKLKLHTGEPNGLNIPSKEQFNRDIVEFAGNVV